MLFRSRERPYWVNWMREPELSILTHSPALQPVVATLYRSDAAGCQSELSLHHPGTRPVMAPPLALTSVAPPLAAEVLKPGFLSSSCCCWALACWASRRTTKTTAHAQRVRSQAGGSRRHSRR